MPVVAEFSSSSWTHPSPSSLALNLLAETAKTSSNNTVPDKSQDGHSRLWVVWVALLVCIYVVGVIFGIIWICSRDYLSYDKHRPPWIPSFCEEEVCCVLLEPIAILWPALLWPLFLLLLTGYFVLDKLLHATTCCGRELSRSKRQKRRANSLGSIELASRDTSGTLTPASSMSSAWTLSGKSDDIRSPPPVYQSRRNSFPDQLGSVKGPPARSNSDPLPREQKVEGYFPGSSRRSSVTLPRVQQLGGYSPGSSRRGSVTSPRVQQLGGCSPNSSRHNSIARQLIPPAKKPDLHDSIRYEAVRTSQRGYQCKPSRLSQSCVPTYPQVESPPLMYPCGRDLDSLEVQQHQLCDSCRRGCPM